jgi:starch phosphorylase
VRFGGNVHFDKDPETGKDIFVQENYESVLAIPYDMPIVGYGNHVVNTLRIWDAQAITDFKLDAFDRGEYHKAIEQENLAKTIVEVLYPNDNHYEGKELRLKQQYFFISASVQRAVAKYKKHHDDITKLYEKVTFQLNDTHPTVAVPELMRILMDVEGLGWDEAWEITTDKLTGWNFTKSFEPSEDPEYAANKADWDKLKLASSLENCVKNAYESHEKRHPGLVKNKEMQLAIEPTKRVKKMLKHFPLELEPYNLKKAA